MKIIKKIAKKLWMPIACFIIACAVVSSLFRGLTPFVKQYKTLVEEQLTSVVGQPVTLTSLETNWVWFHPVLQLNHLTIHGANDSIHVEKLMIGIHIINSLLSMHLEPGIIYINDTALTLKQSGNHWSIDGFDTSFSTAAMENSADKKAMLERIANQSRFIVHNLTLHLHTDTKNNLSFKIDNLSIANQNGAYKFNAMAKLAQKESAYLKLLGFVQIDLMNPSLFDGHLYLSVSNLSLPYWLSFVPELPVQIHKGLANLSLWIDVEKGIVKSTQAQLGLRSLQIERPSGKQLINSFYANMSYASTTLGWKFAADQIYLNANKVIWPKNQLALGFDAEHQSYLLFVKSVLVGPLLQLADNFEGFLPQSKMLNALQMKGVLSDFQVAVTNSFDFTTESFIPSIVNNQSLPKQSPHLSYVLTRFEQLGWDGVGQLPKVKNLHGVVQWEPNQGHLELDSEDTLIALPKYPKLKLSILNGAVDWKALNNGYRVNIERFALSEPKLSLNLKGVLDEVGQGTFGFMQLNSSFHIKELQQWMAYLPKDKLKPKLYQWLTKGIKRIESATGQLIFNGRIADFPFDNQQGQFSIASYMQGGDIFITPKWQLIKELNGYLRFKNRNLDVDVIHGDAQGVPLEQINLRIDDIGRDKETLLVHAKVIGPAQKMLDFVLHSPLKKQLDKLKMLMLTGNLDSDLHVEVPLYPENDKNLAEVAVTLQDNTLQFKTDLLPLSINHLNGQLFINEKGAKKSSLSGNAFGYPWTINLETTPKSHLTNILFSGQCSMDVLKTKLKNPVMAYLQGVFSLDGILKIYGNNQAVDTLTLKTNASGLAIKLPEPLGKERSSIAPLIVRMDFNSSKAMHIHGHYNKKLGVDLNFTNKPSDGLALQSGQISLGSPDAAAPKETGFSFIGTLDGFDLEQWTPIVRKYIDGSTSSSISKVFRTITIKLKQLKLFRQSFDDVSIIAKRSDNLNWMFRVQQKKCSADLRYQSSTNTLTGLVRYLHLDKIKMDNANHKKANISLEKVPNLDIRVDDIRFGKIMLGNMILKSHTSSRKWNIEHCSINSPSYNAIISGYWQSEKGVDTTKINIKGESKALAKSLELWDITPSVDASSAVLEFNGGWDGSIFDYSLKGIHGSSYLQLKNGRVTHLSSSTEEKLGLGKLLSILSLQTIPRRLQLDFSDLSHNGYSFDKFQGHFSMKQGVLSTGDSYLDGPVAKATMNGDLDVAKQTYHLNLTISPHITASLPVVATIAGGPVVGIAAWVANKVINQGFQKITSYTYKISGPWSNPLIEHVSIKKA